MSAGGGGLPARWGTRRTSSRPDGHVMAYRAGAVITGKEFLSPHHTDPENPGWPPMYLFFSPGTRRRCRDVARRAHGQRRGRRGPAARDGLARLDRRRVGGPRGAGARGDGVARRQSAPISGPGGHGSMLGHAAGGSCPWTRLRHACSGPVRGRRQLRHLLRRRRLLGLRLCHHARRRDGRPGGAGAADTRCARTARRRDAASVAGAARASPRAAAPHGAASARAGRPRSCRTRWPRTSCST